MAWKYAPSDPSNIDGYVQYNDSPTRLVDANAIADTVGLLGDWWDTATPTQKLQDIAGLPVGIMTGIGNQIQSEIANPTTSGMLDLSTMVGAGGLLLGDAPKGALGMFGGVIKGSRALSRAELDLIPYMASDMGVSDDVVAGLIKHDKLAAQVNPISEKTGREVGFHTPYSGSRKVKTDKLAELTSGFEKETPDYGNLGNSNIEDFSGKTLYPMPADRTSRDYIKTVNGIDVGNYHNQGGYRYMLPPEVGGGGGFASGSSVMNRYDKLSRELGGDGIAVGTPMSGRGSDFATSGTDIVKRMGVFDNMSDDASQMLSGEINKKILAANKSAILSAKKKAKENKVPYVEPKLIENVGDVRGQDFSSRLDNEPMLRKAYMEATDLDRVAKHPEIVDAITVRHAITDDRFRHLRRGEGDPLSGMDFLSLDGGTIPSIDAPSPHPSYDTHASGVYMPSLLVPTPRSVLFPDFTDQMIRENRPVSEWNYMFDRIKPTQEVNQRVIDGQNAFQEGILSGDW